MKYIKLAIVLILGNCYNIRAQEEDITEEILEERLKIISQDALSYIDSTHSRKINSTYNIKKVEKIFLKKYYLPWTNPYKIISLDTLKNNLTKRLKKFLKTEGWGTNKKPLKENWKKKIIKNINIGSFPNCNKTAISVRDTNIRMLPTNLPSFSNPEDYPFDNMQDSFLQAFEPVHIVHNTIDGWSLIIDGRGTQNWVRSTDLAFVDKKFKKKWMQNKYLVITSDNSLIKYGSEITKGRIGQILPINHKSKIIYCALKDKNGYAFTVSGKINKKFYSPFPLKANEHNMAIICNNLINTIYGWGGLYGLRDCSSILKDLFATVGIFLPRDSGPQSKSGEFIDISNLSEEEKYKKIIQEAIPFMTLIRMPGHIFLYIGNYKNVPLVYHCMWGYKIVNNNKEGRCVLGKTVIMPLNFVKKCDNVSKEWIERIIGFVKLEKHLK